MEQSTPDALSQVGENPILRLEVSGIPQAAEQRLQALRGSASALFTTTLSVDEFALTQAAGLRPVSQVMGRASSSWQGPEGTRGLTLGRRGA